jgi:ribosomal RNA methyltransferase Nop2
MPRCRSRSDHLLQLQHDIATYFGYNTFLVGKLMKLFPLDEVSSQTSFNRRLQSVLVQSEGSH